MVMMRSALFWDVARGITEEDRSTCIAEVPAKQHVCHLSHNAPQPERTVAIGESDTSDLGRATSCDRHLKVLMSTE